MGEMKIKPGKQSVEIIKSTGNHDISYVLADLSSLGSIHDMAVNIINKYPSLDILINNAGAMFMNKESSKEGYEITFAVNYLSHYLLTRLLLPLLERSKPSRIINVSSVIIRMLSQINIDCVSKPGFYKGIRAYSASKICMTLFTFEMAERLKGRSITSNAGHPGLVINTGFGNNSKNPLIRGILSLRAPVLVLGRLGLNIIETNLKKGAATNIYLATSEDVSNVTGIYFADSRPAKTTKFIVNREMQKKLYQLSEEMVKDYL